MSEFKPDHYRFCSPQLAEDLAARGLKVIKVLDRSGWRFAYRDYTLPEHDLNPHLSADDIPMLEDP